MYTITLTGHLSWDKPCFKCFLPGMLPEYSRGDYAERPSRTLYCKVRFKCLLTTCGWWLPNWTAQLQTHLSPALRTNSSISPRMQEKWFSFKPQVCVFAWGSLNDLGHCHSDSLNFSKTFKIAYSSILFFLFLITLHPEVQQHYLKFSPNSSLSLSPRLVHISVSSHMSLPCQLITVRT